MALEFTIDITVKQSRALWNRRSLWNGVERSGAYPGPLLDLVLKPLPNHLLCTVSELPGGFRELKVMIRSDKLVKLVFSCDLIFA